MVIKMINNVNDWKIDIKGTLWKLWFFESILSAWKTFPPHLINDDEDDHDDPEVVDHDEDDYDDGIHPN